MFKFSKWYNNYQSPFVLMLDDLSDAYIDKFKRKYKNDWGFMCNDTNSTFEFINSNILQYYPNLKITFFLPYLKHNLLSNCKLSHKRYDVGERLEFTNFLNFLISEGHEIAYHGSHHGKYNKNQNWIQEWQLYSNIEEGLRIIKRGLELFKKTIGVNILGGKYCGYSFNIDSDKMIDKLDFLYWCRNVNYQKKSCDIDFFGQQPIVDFPTNFAGNSFCRLSYKTNHFKTDSLKCFTRFFQPLYNIFKKKELLALYKKRHVISVQEHYGHFNSMKIQSSNIISDKNSILKILKILKNKSIWYATCQDIAKYFYVKSNSSLEIQNDRLTINFKNKKKLYNTYITLENDVFFKLEANNCIFNAIINNNKYVINVEIKDNENVFKIK